MRYMMLIHHDEAELAKAPPSLWGEYCLPPVLMTANMVFGRCNAAPDPLLSRRAAPGALSPSDFGCRRLAPAKASGSG